MKVIITIHKITGGGFALAEGCKATGLSSMIGGSLNGLEGMPKEVVLLVVVLVTQFITEFTSNVAIANLILPVLANMVRFFSLFYLLLDFIILL